MLAYDLGHWTAFLATALVLNLSPGPDMAFILGHTLGGGRRAGVAAMFGIWSGALCHVVLAAVGLSAILATSAAAFAVVKWAGVAYLFWLGAQALRSPGGALRPAATAAGPRLGRVFLNGVLVDVLNPKVAIFFLAFLPQFVTPEAGPVWLQLLAHGVLVIAVAALVEPPMILIGDRLTQRLRSSQRLTRWLDRTLGALFLGLAAKLALLQR
jgi:threonine/homoserine/homoserine lactone efflux protein